MISFLITIKRLIVSQNKGRGMIVFLAILLSGITGVNGFTDDKGVDSYDVAGTIHGSGTGRLTVYLITKEDMGRKNTGYAEIVVDLNNAEAGGWVIPFRFENIPAGEFAVRVFQDINGNGELDRKGFRPTEPWGFSWNDSPKRGIPLFKDIVFTAPKYNLKILLED